LEGFKNMPSGIYVRTKKHNENISKKLIGIKFSLEHINNLKQAQNRPEVIEKRRKSNTGKKRTPEQNERNRQAQIKRFKENPVSEETKENQRQKMLGKHWKLSDKSKENIRQSQLGKKHSPEQIEKHRQAMIGKHWKVSKEGRENNRKARLGKNTSPKSSRGIHTYYQSPLQGEVCFRSSYELAYAKYLDSINEPYFYEAGIIEMTINGKQTTYRPDFCLPLRCEFIEIKGYMNSEAQLKCDRFKEELNDEELMGIFRYKILFGKDLKELGINLKIR